MYRRRSCIYQKSKMKFNQTFVDIWPSLPKMSFFFTFLPQCWTHTTELDDLYALILHIPFSETKAPNIFWHDSAPLSKLRYMKTWFAMKTWFLKLEWKTLSILISAPLNRFWDKLEHQQHRRPPRLTSLSYLTSALAVEWTQIPTT